MDNSCLYRGLVTTLTLILQSSWRQLGHFFDAFALNQKRSLKVDAAAALHLPLDVSDLDKFEEVYTDFGALTAGVDPRTLERDCFGHPNEEVPGLDLPGRVALHSLANVPKSWPLERLTIPLSAASKHLDFFLARCCLGQVPGGAPFSQRSEQATACTNRMQIRN